LDPKIVGLAKDDFIEIKDLSRSPDIDSRGEGNVNARVDAGALTIYGWAVGRKRAARDVEVQGDHGETLAQVPIALDRPDIIATLGDLPDTACSGFRVTLQPSRPGPTKLTVRVIFDEGPPAVLGTLQVEAELVGPARGGSGPAWAVRENRVERDKVLVGRDGWLFLHGDTNDAIGQLTGRVTLSAEQKEAWMRLLEERVRTIADTGTTWLTAVVPDKEILYAEHLPPELLPLRHRPIHDFLEVAARVRAPVIYLLDDLLAAKLHGDLYLRSDTHWNHRGAFIAYKAICRELKRRGVDLEMVDDKSLEWRETRRHGDLGSKLYPDRVDDRDVRAKVEHWPGRQVYDNEIHNHGRVLVYEQDRTDGPNCLVFGDSFSLRLLDFLKASFRRVVFVHTNMLVEEIVRFESPDVVLTLPIERFLIRVPDDRDALAMLEETARSKDGELLWSVD
jgi:alginate O-acetyltransferase complex protein AlgJ